MKGKKLLGNPSEIPPFYKPFSPHPEFRTILIWEGSLYHYFLESKNKYQEPLLSGETYHIYNRAVGYEKLFLNDENYRYFLKEFVKHIAPVADVYCYCLLPNHFHFLLRIKKFGAAANDGVHSSTMSKRFSNFFNAYTKAFNVYCQRKGTLFMRPFKRRAVQTDSYFTQLIHYIHANPVHHGYCGEMANWKYSSYAAILSDQPTRLLREEIIQWFGSREKFIAFHEEPVMVRSEWEFE